MTVRTPGVLERPGIDERIFQERQKRQSPEKSGLCRMKDGGGAEIRTQGPVTVGSFQVFNLCLKKQKLTRIFFPLYLDFFQPTSHAKLSQQSEFRNEKSSERMHTSLRHWNSLLELYIKTVFQRGA
jgi:hypothetical protein